MARRRKEEDEFEAHGAPGITPLAREQILMSLASNLAEKQLREGTASSQIVAQLLKASSSREVLEQERLRFENALTRAKTEAMEAAEKREEVFQQALVAFGVYSGRTPKEEVYEGDAQDLQ